MKRSDKQEKAAEAIRHIGTNAVPYLLEALTNRDSDLKLKLLATLAKQHWIKFPPPETNRSHRAAALAFDVLGPKAKGAVPELAGILKRPFPGRTGDDSTKMATIALAAIDPEGRAALVELVNFEQLERNVRDLGPGEPPSEGAAESDRNSSKQPDQ